MNQQKARRQQASRAVRPRSPGQLRRTGQRQKPRNNSDAGRRGAAPETDGRTWQERTALARILGAFLPQDHRAAKRLHVHLYRAHPPLAARTLRRMEVFADAVLTDDVPQAITIYTEKEIEGRIAHWKD